MRRRAALLVAIAALALPAAAAAQCPKTSLGDIEDEVMCPVCGTTLELATEAPQAQRQREFIEGLISRCRSKEEVKAALRREFGNSALAVPDADDESELASYLIPALAIGLALAAIGTAVLRWRRSEPSPESAAPGPAPSERETARLDEDLRRYD